jgi:hypothetical protein
MSHSMSQHARLLYEPFYYMSHPMSQHTRLYTRLPYSRPLYEPARASA